MDFLHYYSSYFSDIWNSYFKIYTSTQQHTSGGRSAWPFSIAFDAEDDYDLTFNIGQLTQPTIAAFIGAVTASVILYLAWHRYFPKPAKCKHVKTNSGGSPDSVSEGRPDNKRSGTGGSFQSVVCSAGSHHAKRRKVFPEICSPTLTPKAGLPGSPRVLRSAGRHHARKQTSWTQTPQQQRQQPINPSIYQQSNRETQFNMSASQFPRSSPSQVIPQLTPTNVTSPFPPPTPDYVFSSKFYSIGEDHEGRVKYIVNEIKVAEHLKEFILLPVPIGFILQCSVVRDKKGIDRGLFPTYFLHLEFKEGKRIFLMSARKRKKSKTSNYMISVDPCFLYKDKGESMVGKVRSNLLGTHYSIYDGGKSPKSAAFMESADVYREQLGVVLYEYNLLGFRGPRKLKVLIPSLNEYRRYVHRAEETEDDSDNIIERSKTDVIGGTLKLKNKWPAWNEETQSYVLNFHGRAFKPSVKNFQLVYEDNEDHTILQFGRIKQDEFTLDFRFPLCPLQAFAIALTSFDNKLACE